MAILIKKFPLHLNMDQAVIIKLIEQVILKEHSISDRHTIDIKPAWKHAFYNAAKKNNDGSIVIKRSILSLIVFAIPILALLIGSVADGNYILLCISGIAIAILIAIKRYYYNKVMIINAAGITFNSRTYCWKDYSAAFISIIALRKTHRLNLILVDSAYRITSLEIAEMSANAVGTAIRDFQPEAWRIQPLRP
jgi:hypothetical protein